MAANAWPRASFGLAGHLQRIGSLMGLFSAHGLFLPLEFPEWPGAWLFSTVHAVAELPSGQVLVAPVALELGGLGQRLFIL